MKRRVFGFLFFMDWYFGKLVNFLKVLVGFFENFLDFLYFE